MPETIPAPSSTPVAGNPANNSTPMPVVDTQPGNNPPPSPAAAPEQLPINTAPKQTAIDVQPPAPGSMFNKISHAFAGALLGTLAGKQEVDHYEIDPTTGVQKPVLKDLHPRDQIAKIARNALMGLAAGAEAKETPGHGADWAAGLGAGAEATRTYTQQQDLLKRKQASEQFETEQKAMLNQATNAHLLLENIQARQNLLAADLKSNQDFANVGGDSVEAAIAGGNSIVGKRDMTSDEAKQFRADNPDYMKWTSVMSKAEPQFDENGNPVLDPKTGVQQVQRKYTFLDLTKPVKIQQSMIDHLQQIGFPGADTLHAGDTMSPEQFRATLWNGVKMYNAANNDAKNWEVKEIVDKDNNLIYAGFNNITKSTHVFHDPDTGDVIKAPEKVEKDTIFDPTTGVTQQYGVILRTGKRVSYLGEAGANATSPFTAIGDYSKSGPDFLQSIPPQFRDDVLHTATYTLNPANLGRSNFKTTIINAAAHYADTTGDSYNDQNYKLRFDYMNNYQGDGPIGQARSRLNIAVNHLNLLNEAVGYLPINGSTGNLKALNAIAEQMGLQTGDSALVVYNTIATKAAGEAAGAVKQGQVTDQDVRDQKAQFDASLGPKTQHDNIMAQYLLLDAQQKFIGDQFKQNMGGASPEKLGRPVLSDENQKIMDKWVRRPITSTAPDPSTHPHRLAADQKTMVFQMPDGSVQDATGAKYDPKTFMPIQAAQGVK